LIGRRQTLSNSAEKHWHARGDHPRDGSSNAHSTKSQRAKIGRQSQYARKPRCDSQQIFNRERGLELKTLLSGTYPNYIYPQSLLLFWKKFSSVVYFMMSRKFIVGKRFRSVKYHSEHLVEFEKNKPHQDNDSVE